MRQWRRRPRSIDIATIVMVVGTTGAGGGGTSKAAGIGSGDAAANTAVDILAARVGGSAGTEGGAFHAKYGCHGDLLDCIS